MPKLITTHTRIAYLGKPRILTTGGGFGGLAVAQCHKDLTGRAANLKKANSKLTNLHPEKATTKPLWYRYTVNLNYWLTGEVITTQSTNSQLQENDLNGLKGRLNTMSIGDAAIRLGENKYFINITP